MTLQEIIEALKKIMLKYSNYITEAWIFGSFAKNNQHKTSDIDIAINCTDWTKWFDIVDDINEIETIRRFDIHNINGCDFVFDMEDIRNGIKLY